MEQFHFEISPADAKAAAATSWRVFSRALAVATKEATDAPSVVTQETTLEDSNRNDTAQALESLSPSVSPSGDGCREVAELESMNVLADRHRVPTWQQAAVNRLMGWEAGKMVSNADYVSALDKLKARPVGGGRMG